MKSINLDSKMVNAILSEQKTSIIKVIKCKYSNTHLEMFTNKYGTRLIELQNNIEGETYGKNPDGSTWHKLLAMREIQEDFKPFKKGETIFVKESWCDRWLSDGFLSGKDRYGYKADGIPSYGYWGDDKKGLTYVWISSKLMNEEKARLYLYIKSISVKQVKDLTDEDALKSGFTHEIDKGENLSIPNLESARNRLISSLKKDSPSLSDESYVWIISFAKK